MEYSLERIHEACSGNLDEADHFWQEFFHFHTAVALHSQDRPDMFRAFLKGMPSTVAQLKIRDRFQAIAEERGAQVGNFRWWDVANPPEFHLLADLVCAGLTIQLGLNWRAYKPGTKPIGSMTDVSFRPNPTETNSAYLVIESHTYQEVKAAFRYWLNRNSEPIPAVLRPPLSLAPSP